MTPIQRKYKLQIKSFFHLLEIAKRTKEDDLIVYVLDELITLHHQLLADLNSSDLEETLMQLLRERDNYAKLVAK